MAATRQVPFFLAQVPGGGQDTTQRFALQVTGVARMWYVFALNKATIPMPFTLPGGSTQNVVSLYCTAVPDHAPPDERRRLLYTWEKKYTAIEDAGRISVTEPEAWPDLPEDRLTPEQERARFITVPAFRVAVCMRFSRFNDQDMQPVLA